jgi:hydrogenase nickel incorporation protein HypA/HybF
MHELAIAEALIEQVQRELRRAGHSGPVTRVDLSIGRLTGVHCDSLRFALELLAPGTLVEKAEVSIRQPKAACACRACAGRTELDDLAVVCPRCGSGEIVIEGGRDLLLESIEVAD